MDMEELWERDSSREEKVNKFYLVLDFIQYLLKRFYGFVEKIALILSKKGRQRLTLMLVPHSQSRVISVHFSLAVFVMFLIFSVLLLSLAAYTVLDYARTKNEVIKLRAQRKGTMEHLALILEEVSEAREQMSRIIPIIQDIQKYTGVKVNTFDLSAIGKLEDVPDVPPEYYDLKEIVQELKASRKVLGKLKEFLAERKKVLEYTPTGWPTVGRFTSGYGWRRDPLTKQRRFHYGVDIANFPGTPVYATASGKVSFAGWRSGYGLSIIIRHDYGYETMYAHCSVLLVREGQRVRKGQLIARMGRTGRTTGPHLHYEVRINGIKVNPLKYMMLKG